MAYCTSDDLKKGIPEAEIIRLTDDTNAGVMNTDNRDEAINKAANEMDGYLGVKYLLPIASPVPDILVELNKDIAIYKLYARKKTEIPESVIKRRDDAIAFLKAVVKSEATLGIQPPPAAPNEGEYEGAPQVSTRHKMFGRRTMRKY